MSLIQFPNGTHLPHTPGMILQEAQIWLCDSDAPRELLVSDKTASVPPPQGRARAFQSGGQGKDSVGSSWQD